jgi:hypothetical protein
MFAIRPIQKAFLLRQVDQSDHMYQLRRYDGTFAWNIFKS